MPHRVKEKNGDGARMQAETADKSNPPAQMGERSQAPARVRERAQPLATQSQHPLGRLRDEVDSLFERFFGQWPMPMEWGANAGSFWDMDVDENDKEIVVRTEAPGFEPKDFEIHVTGDRLTIRAERQQEGQEKEGYWQRRYGRFQRSLTLPAAVNADNVEAQYRNGVLELHLPRAEEAQRRRIEVKS